MFRCSFRPKNVERMLPCEAVFFDPPYKLVEQIAPELRERVEALPGEAFGDFCHRKGKDDLVATCGELKPGA